MKIALTRYTARKPARLSKKFSLDAEGRLKKESGGKIIDGTAERITVDGISELAALRQGLTPKQALGYGINGHDIARVVPKYALASTKDTLPVIARDHEHIHWPEGPGILFIDYDPRDGQEPLAREALLDLLRARWPALGEAPLMWHPSSGSCIFNSETDAELLGVRGQRVCVVVRESSDIPRAGQALTDQLWLAGLGWIKISDSGSLLTRTPVDAMFQPERLDFAGAECVPPLVQRLPKPLVFNADAEPIDTKVTLPDLTEAERAEVARLQAEAKAALAKEAAEVHARWMEGRLGEMAKCNPGVPEAELRDVLQRAVDGQVLYSEFVLYDARKRPITVREMLADPGKWHHKYIRDPLEPEYSSSAAWVCIDGKSEPFLHSHAHGLGVRYTLFDERKFGGGAQAEPASDDAAQGEGEGGAEEEAEGGAGESLDAAVERLAKLPPLQYDRVRSTEAKRLGVRSATLDAEVAAARKRMGLDAADEEGKQGKPIEFEEVDPWPSSVDGAQLLDDLVEAFETLMVLPPHAPDALSLWVLFTYLIDAADTAPLLVLSSPVKRCGKTRLIEVLTRLVHRPLPTNNITPAALFRVIAVAAPCILFDEVDALLEADKTGEIRGLMNSGNTRATANVIRTVGENFEPRAFTVWCPKLLALIGSLEKQWSTVADRAVVLPIQRKPTTRKLPRVRRAGIDFGQLRRRMVRWAADHVEALRASDPPTPEGLNDRAADNWRILLAIADAAGGTWPKKASAAALSLSGDEPGVSVEADGVRVRLLSDIRAIFTELGCDRITTAELIQKLVAIDDPEAPWDEWNPRAGWMDKQIKPRHVAKLLQPFGIKPSTIRLPDGSKTDTAKGYLREKFEAAFASYLT